MDVVKYLKGKGDYKEMQKKMEKIRKGLIEVFQKPQYWVLSLIIAGIFFVINIVLPNIDTIVQVATTLTGSRYAQFVIALIRGGIANMTQTSFVMLTIIAVLVGVMVSLITYKVRMEKIFSAHDGKTTTIGAILGLAAPGCASCGIGLLSAVGLTSALTYLPFKGIEISALSIVLLAGSTGSLASRIADGNSCKINFKKKR